MEQFELRLIPQQYYLILGSIKDNAIENSLIKGKTGLGNNLYDLYQHSLPFGTMNWGCLCQRDLTDFVFFFQEGKTLKQYIILLPQ